VTAFENLHYLTKKIGGRLAGSSQMSKAENWGATSLRQLPANTVYMQRAGFRKG
jgi:carboxypeptidase Q